MFRRIRLELAKSYTAMLIGLLTAVACLGFVIFAGSVYVQQKEQVALLALEECEEFWYVLKYGEALGQKMDIDDSTAAKKIFYRAFAADGREIGVHRAWRDMIDTHAREEMDSGALADEEVVFHLFKVPGHWDVMAYMMMKKTIYDGDTALGTVYAGRDVRSFVKFIGSVLLFWLIFLGVASWVAYHLARRMADKAMVPIEVMYTRQKEFTADASHELRTPLSIFLSSVETIEMDRENRLSVFSQAVLADLKDEVKKMRQLIENLLTLARNDQIAAKRPEQTFFLLNETVREAVEKWQAIAREKQISLTYAAEDEFTVLANRGHILQVVGILFDNACKYTPQGGSVHVRLQENDKQVILAVADEGGGIEEKYHELIFERFFRVDKMRSRQVEGTGLGLSIAKCLVELNGGRISLDSEVGKGSTFKVTLPLR